MNERSPAHAGTAYPAEGAVLRRLLERILAEPVPAGTTDVPRAVIVPHLDLQAARRVYAAAGASLRGTCPRRILLLGPGHSLIDRPISLTERDYRTPLGLWATDRGAVRRLRAAGDDSVAADDSAHEDEHSLELPLLLLHHLFAGADPAPTLVPVLLGPLEHYLEVVDRPAEIPELELFLEELQGLVSESDLVVGSADLSHVGPRYGDERSAAEDEPAVREHDCRLLQAIASGSAADLWSAGRSSKRFRVCGLSVLACLLEAAPGLRGDVRAYEICHDQETRSAVSCAALVLRCAVSR